MCNPQGGKTWFIPATLGITGNSMFWHVDDLKAAGWCVTCTMTLARHPSTKHLQVTNIHDFVTQLFVSVCACSSHCKNASDTVLWCWETVSTLLWNCLGSQRRLAFKFLPVNSSEVVDYTVWTGSPNILLMIVLLAVLSWPFLVSAKVSVSIQILFSFLLCFFLLICNTAVITLHSKGNSKW